jgi:hypothetical protein
MASAPLTTRPPLVTAGPAGDFAWPDFDRWQATFTAIGIFPPRWDGLQCAPPAHTREAATYRLRKLVLFDEWLDMLARRPIMLAHYARQGLRARVARQDERAPCPACDPFNAAEIRLEVDALPPFHPGCRCVLVAVPAGPVRRRGRSHERSRSRPK